MGDINTAYFDRVRYTLRNKNQGSLVITEPIGWKSDEKEYARHEQYHGIIARFSNSLRFVGTAKDYIQLVYDVDGINAEIELKREEKHPRTDIWTLTYSGYLDLSTLQNENNKISIKFNSGGIEQLLKAREGEQVEIDRATTIDGKSIDPITPVVVDLEGRRVFLKTKYERDEVNDTVILSNSSKGNTYGKTAPIPIKIKSQSHENATDPVPNSEVGDDSLGRTGAGSLSLMLFANSDTKRDLNVKLNFEIKTEITRWDEVNAYRFWVRLVKYKDGVDFNFKSHNILLTVQSYEKIKNKKFAITFNDKIELLKGESLALVYDHLASLGGDVSRGHVETKIKLEKVNYIDIEEDSSYKKTTSNAILAHELFDQLVTIATNKKEAFYSDFLGRIDLWKNYKKDGIGAYIAFTHGFWVRQFQKSETPESAIIDGNLFKPLTTSFKDAFQSLDTVWCVGLGIEKIGFRERVRLEEQSYFYNLNVTIKLPNQVTNVKRSVATRYFYSSLEFGSEKGGEYEEACGLDEYNTKSTYNTVINRIKEVYSKVSKYRFDSYGMEFARRKPKALNDTEDTKYDTDIFMLDLFRNPFGFFEQRLWFNKYQKDGSNDDFEKEPTGVFSPETATNLRFSPFNCLLRHSWWFGGGLKKYPTDYVRYGSSFGNSQLKTQLKGGIERSENGTIINSELKRARFLPEIIEFEHKCNFDVMQMVEGTTDILGKQIVNFYGLVEFTNEKNEIEKGFLLNLKPNGKGAWMLLKANI